MPGQFISLSDYKSAPAPARGRHALAAGVSIAAHALAALAILYLAPNVERPHTRWVLAYIVALGDNGGALAKGNSISSEAPPAAGMISRLPPKPAERKRKPRHALPAFLAGVPAASDHRIKPVPQKSSEHEFELASLPPSAIPQPGRETRGSDTETHENPDRGGAGGNGSQSNRGDPRGAIGASGSGNGGNGTGAGNIAAHAKYGQNPPPLYPAIARRRAQQGTVTLHVLVAADGAVKRAEIQQSSGVDSLDDAALETVRTRWRFVPARRDGIAVESWVVVPIRFTLTDVSKN